MIYVYHVEVKFNVMFTLFKFQGNASGGKRAQIAKIGGKILVDTAWLFINKKNLLPDQRPVYGNCANHPFSRLCFYGCFTIACGRAHALL